MNAKDCAVGVHDYEYLAGGETSELYQCVHCHDLWEITYAELYETDAQAEEIGPESDYPVGR